MSGAQTSTFPPANVLMSTLSGQLGTEVRQNQLMNQQKEQAISAENMAQVGQAAAGLLSAYPDEASRAAAYAPLVGFLQSQGYAKNAPAQYPGEGTLRAIVAASVPATEQFKLQQTKAALDAVWPNAPTPTTATPTTGAAAAPSGGTGAQGQVPPLATAYGQGGPNNTQVPQDWLPYFQEASQRTGIPADVLIAQMRQESGFNRPLPEPQGEIGPAQVMPSTARSPGAGVAPVDPSMLRDPRTAINFQADYLKSRLPAGTSPSDPAALNRALYGYNGGGDKDYVAHVTRYLPAPGGGTVTAATAPAPTQYAGPGVPPAATTAAPGPTVAPAAAPAPETPWDLPGAPAPDLPPPSTPTAAPAPAAPAAPAQPAPAAAGSPPAIPGRTPPPAPTVTVPPPVPLPPAPPPVDGRYLTAQDYQDLSRMKAGLVTNPNGAQLLQAEIDRRATTNVQRIQNYQAVQEKQRADAIAAQQLQLQGGDAALKTWQAANPAPTTPRFTQNTEAVWNSGTKQFEPVTPDNTNRGPHVAGSWGVNNTGQMQFLPGATRPAQGDYQQQEAAYHFDQPIVQTATTAGQASQNSLIQLNELADLINKGQASGPEGPFRKRVAEFMEQHGFTPDAIKSWTGMSSGSDADLLQKLAVATVGASAKADLGSNVGIQSLHLYENANPGMTMLGGANQKVTNMIRVTRAMQDDYTQGLQEHFNTNQASFLHGGGYNEPVSVYNAQWQQRNNPQIGAAAMGALNGDGYNDWAGRLRSPDDARSALQLALRVDPNAKVETAKGTQLVKDVLASWGK